MQTAMNEIQARLFPEYSGRMRLRKLRDNMITVHCKPGSMSITLNKYITAEIREKGMGLACIESDGGKAYLCLENGRTADGDFVPLRYNTRNNNAIIYSTAAVKRICDVYGIEDGDYYFIVERVEDEGHYIGLQLAGITDGQWYVPSPSKDDEQQGVDGAGNAARYTPSSILGVVPTTLPTLEVYTDEQLYNELRRRGYEGKLTKHTTLE